MIFQYSHVTKSINIIFVIVVIIYNLNLLNYITVFYLWRRERNKKEKYICCMLSSG